jgi:hypothetical protein
MTMDDRSLTDQLMHNEMPLAQALSELRREPSPDLYRRLAAIPQHRSRRPHRLAWVAVSALLVAALLFFSPAARATIDQVVERVGQVYFTVTDKLPYRDDATVVEGITMSLDEARAAVSFDFGVPTALPAGCELDRVEVWMPNETVGQVVELTWRQSDGGVLELSVHAYDELEPIQTVVGLDSIETVQVNGRDAALVRGGWDSDTGAWGYQDKTITLVWQVQAVQYSLLAYPERFSADELVSIAESIE